METKKILTVRVESKLLKKTQTLAKMYGFDSVSDWVRHCLDNYTPKMKKAPKKKSQVPQSVR